MVKKQLEGLGLGPKRAMILLNLVESPGSETMELLEDTHHLIHPHAILAMGAGAMCLIEQTWGLILLIWG